MKVLLLNKPIVDSDVKDVKVLDAAQTTDDSARAFRKTADDLQYKHNGRGHAYTSRAYHLWKLGKKARVK